MGRHGHVIDAMVEAEGAREQDIVYGGARDTADDQEQTKVGQILF